MKTKKINERKMYDLKIIEIIERKSNKSYMENKTMGFGCIFKKDNGGGAHTYFYKESKTLKELIKIIDKELREYKPIHMTRWERLIYKFKQILIICR